MSAPRPKVEDTLKSIKELCDCFVAGSINGNFQLNGESVTLKTLLTNFKSISEDYKQLSKFPEGFFNKTMGVLLKNCAIVVSNLEVLLNGGETMSQESKENIKSSFISEIASKAREISSKITPYLAKPDEKKANAPTQNPESKQFHQKVVTLESDLKLYLISRLLDYEKPNPGFNEQRKINKANKYAEQGRTEEEKRRRKIKVDGKVAG